MEVNVTVFYDNPYNFKYFELRFQKVFQNIKSKSKHEMEF